MTKTNHIMLIAYLLLGVLPSMAQDNAYIFTYFDTKKEAAGLCIAYSYDGYTWTAINDGQPMMQPTVGKDKLLRDPSICQAPDGTFHLVWTVGWSGQSIGYATSRDLVHWSEQQELPVMADFPDCRNTWAPELFYDASSKTYYIYWASTVPGAKGVKTEGCLSEDDYNHRIYCTTTRDFTRFSKTRLWYNPDFNAIDAAVVRDPETGELLMAVKNENLKPAEKNIRIARATSMKAGFGKEVSAPINTQGKDGKPYWCEGPAPLFVGSNLVVYYDMYGAHRYGASVSHDHGRTWEDCTDRIRMPRGMSHGTAISVPRNVADQLLMWNHQRQGLPICIIPGDYPDPSILRDGKDFYMTHSPFQMGPAFLIWHSTDLLHWTPICRASKENIWAMAPDLVKCNGRYYIYFPQGGSNWVIWADDIRGPWSKPINLHTRGIDPGHLQMPDGKRYLYTSEGYVVKLTDDGLATDGEPQHIYDGWDFPDDWQTECKCLESPKMTYRDGWVYLTSAEGGTAGPPTSHMVVSARSRSPFGPWENSPYNPIVHTYSKDEPWWSKGHGSLVDDADGNWWIVYHAYANDLHTLGRQTLIEPIEWTEDGWFCSKVNSEKLIEKSDATPSQSSIASWLSDDFSSDTLGLQWAYWGNYDPAATRKEDGHLVLSAKGKELKRGNLLSVTAQDAAYEVQVDVTIGEGNIAGLMLYYDGSAYAGLTFSRDYLNIYSSAGNRIEQRNRIGNSMTIRLHNNANRLSIYVSTDKQTWATLLEDADVSALNHNNYMGFYALRPTLVSYGSGEARFDNFVYRKNCF